MNRRHAPLWAAAEPALQSLLQPASAFEHPSDVVNDPDLTLYEKRAILSSWASDACAVESNPVLRKPPGVLEPVSFFEVLDALQSLDDEPPPRPGGKSMRRRSGSGSPEPDPGGVRQQPS